MLRSRLVSATYLAAIAFGAFWGTWGSAVPRVRDQAHLDDAALGTALLFVSAGALPAMLLTGRALDRWGLRCTAYLIVALGGAGLAAALGGRGLVSLSAGLVAVGMASGAADVAMNSVGGRAEQRTGRPIITRSGALFSVAVVVFSLFTGAAYALDASTWIPFAVVLLLSVVAGVAIHRALTADAAGGTRDAAAGSAGGAGSASGADGGPGAESTGAGGLAALRMPVVPLLVIGTLGALAFASENAHQSWGAVFLEDVLDTGPGLSAIAPAAFAAVVALTRFAASTLDPARARVVLVLGALAAAAGAVVVARAPSVPVALAGLVIAAAGTAALFPTLLSIVSRNVVESSRGRATSIVTVVSYLGFLLGPVYVGLWAAATDLRGAMIAIAALGVALAVLTLPLLRLSRYAIASPRAMSTTGHGR